jgi:hypothetical protein
MTTTVSGTLTIDGIQVPFTGTLSQDAPAGPTGPAGGGPTGPTGSTGAGMTGAQGPTGPTGPAGSSITGPTGPTAPTGPTSGPTAPTGPTAPPPSSFDFFISPKGDDNNAGTLSSPWSITALNSKQSTYSDKKIGFIGDQGVFTAGTIGGVQTTLAALGNAAGNNQPTLNVNGGTAAASTYLASCNSSGVYTPRLAVIDAGSPTSQGFLFGQNSESATQVPKPGYLTYDGLTIRNFAYCAICFENPGGAALQNCVVQNCEIYNGNAGKNVPSNNNPGGIRLWNCVGAVVHNNKIHDMEVSNGVGGFNGVMCYGTLGASIAMVLTNNTIYNCAGVLTKDYNSDFANCSYNYIDHGTFGSAGPNGIFYGCISGHTPAPGVTSLIHHNILLGMLDEHPQSATPLVTGTLVMRNNTFYGTPAYGNFQAMYCRNPGSPAPAVQFINNLVYAVGGYNTSAGAMLLTSGFQVAAATFDKNVYGSNGAAPLNFAITEYTPMTLAAWRSATGCDANSVQVSASPFVSTPSALAPASFATNASAVIGGVTCGALDGSGPVGCSF